MKKGIITRFEVIIINCACSCRSWTIRGRQAGSIGWAHSTIQHWDWRRISVLIYVCSDMCSLFTLWLKEWKDRDEKKVWWMWWCTMDSWTQIQEPKIRTSNDHLDALTSFYSPVSFLLPFFKRSCSHGRTERPLSTSHSIYHHSRIFHNNPLLLPNILQVTASKCPIKSNI